jgi:hypothetical protein
VLVSLTGSNTWQFSPAYKNFWKYRASWDALNHNLLKNHPLGDFCFVEPLVRHFATDRDFLAVKSVGSERQSMLLLTSGKFGVVGSFCPAQTELCPVLTSSIDDLQSLIDQLPYSKLALQLYRQDPDFSAFPETSSALTHEVDDHANTVCVDLSGEFTAYWNARSTKLRKNIGRIVRLMERPDFNWRFTAVESPEAIELAVDRYGDLETQGWKHAGGTAVHSTNVQGRFYREVMRRFAKRGKGIVYELYFDDCLVSSQMAIGNETFLITLKTTYNEMYSDYSPGKLMDYLMLQHEFQLARFSRIEFCTNAGPELIRWGTRTRPISDISMYRNEIAKRVSKFYRKLKSFKS